MNIFEIKNISFSYSNKKVLSGLSLEQQQGGVSLWTGDSGIGKSTLAKILAGHIRPHSGDVLVFGQPLKGPQPDCLYVCHENDLFAWQTMQQHIEFLRLNMPETSLATTDAIKSYIELLELHELMTKYPTQLSMGQARRMQILRSLVLSSRLVLFDETFSALDLKLKNRIFPALLQIWKKIGTSVVIISHESESDFQVSQVVDFSLLVKDR